MINICCACSIKNKEEREGETMIDDPYKVLGLESDASPDDVKKAYRQMAKIYHPDLHPDDPSITEKMNEINEAYDMLTNPAKYAAKKAQQEAQSDPGQTEVTRDYSAAAQNQSIARPAVQPDDSPEIEQAVTLLNSNKFKEALDVLTGVPSTGRDARWYYLSGLAHQMVGNYITATDQMYKASQLEPQNQTYMQLFLQFQKTGQMYEKSTKGFPISPLILVIGVVAFLLGKFYAGN